MNGLLDLSLDLLGFAGAGGTPHSLLSSKLMKQATCWWSFLLTSAPSRSPPKGRCRLLWFWFLTKGYVTHGHGKWKILGTKGKGNVPRWGNVLTQKRDKIRLKATVNGEEWQVPDAGTKDWISRKSKRHTRNSTPTATRFSVYTWDSTCRWANTTLTKATCSRPPPERRLQHPDPGEPWQQGVYAHHDTGS